MMERRKETSIVKNTLKAAGIKARITHGKGTSWGWLYVNLGDPEERNGHEPHPDGWGQRYTAAEVKLHERALGIVQKITGRHGEYDGNILLTSEGAV